MPPEMFIGRKFELQKIEEAKGVNLVYGAYVKIGLNQEKSYKTRV